ncbi:hypothetical protein B0J12DRAFT_298489 [Macrophomina phaseolina]|uniref:Uncharacterized protein n=1 Tax=Macrophomina phaseolina TaxID=35725 RepID=A0ABQ8GPU0_9PEZI|nr:hypothetical protein B0J12DRAFT_298489 [Macrophomina phaseolina]
MDGRSLRVEALKENKKQKRARQGSGTALYAAGGDIFALETRYFPTAEAVLPLAGASALPLPPLTTLSPLPIRSSRSMTCPDSYFHSTPIQSNGRASPAAVSAHTSMQAAAGVRWGNLQIQSGRLQESAAALLARAARLPWHARSNRSFWSNPRCSSDDTACGLASLQKGAPAGKSRSADSVAAFLPVCSLNFPVIYSVAKC